MTPSRRLIEDPPLANNSKLRPTSHAPSAAVDDVVAPSSSSSAAAPASSGRKKTFAARKPPAGPGNALHNALGGEVPLPPRTGSSPLSARRDHEHNSQHAAETLRRNAGGLGEFGRLYELCLDLNVGCAHGRHHKPIPAGTRCPKCYAAAVADATAEIEARTAGVVENRGANVAAHKAACDPSGDKHTCASCGVHGDEMELHIVDDDPASAFFKAFSVDPTSAYGIAFIRAAEAAGLGFDALSRKPFSDIRSFVRFALRGAPDTGGYTGSLSPGGQRAGAAGPLPRIRFSPVLLHRGPELQTL